jgi:hypothetical protein
MLFDCEESGNLAFVTQKLVGHRTAAIAEKP